MIIDNKFICYSCIKKKIKSEINYEFIFDICFHCIKCGYNFKSMYKHLNINLKTPHEYYNLCEYHNFLRIREIGINKIVKNDFYKIVTENDFYKFNNECENIVKNILNQKNINEKYVKLHTFKNYNVPLNFFNDDIFTIIISFLNFNEILKFSKISKGIYSKIIYEYITPEDINQKFRFYLNTDCINYDKSTICHDINYSKYLTFEKINYELESSLNDTDLNYAVVLW